MSQDLEIKDADVAAIAPEELVEVSPAELDDVNGGTVEISATIKYTSPK